MKMKTKFEQFCELLMVLCILALALTAMPKPAQAADLQFGGTNLTLINTTNGSFTAGIVFPKMTGNRIRTIFTVVNTNATTPPSAIGVKYSNLSNTNGGYANYSTNAVDAFGVTNNDSFAWDLIVPAGQTETVNFGADGYQGAISSRFISTNSLTGPGTFEQGWR